MSNLRDEEILIQQTNRTPRSRFPYMAVNLSAQGCQYYGHSWQPIGTAGAKSCTACGITGYCPGCTPVSPLKAAHPFYCTRHTPQQNQEVQA